MYMHNMTKQFACADVGVKCSWSAKAGNENELMKVVAEHAQKEHGMKEIPKDLVDKVKAAIKDI